MHLDLQLTENVEIGAVRLDSQDGLTITQMDSGLEVRNERTDEDPISWQIAIPTADIDGDTTDYDSVRLMWSNTRRGLYSFNFRCFVDDTIYRVRFDGPRQINAAAGHLRHIETFTIKQVLETSPEPTVSPVITGTATVGSTLTVSTGTWSGSPTSYAYQWTLNDVAIAGATGNTYVVQAGDLGKLIGCGVTAADANGGSAMTFAAEVGPIA